MNRNITLLFVTIAACSALFAQSGVKPSFSREIKQNYARRKDQILRAAAKMPASDYSFRATPEVRTYAQQLDHIAEVQLQVCGSILGEKPTADTKATSKDEVIAALNKSFDVCDRAYGETTEANIGDKVGNGTRLGTLWFNASHDNEMYGTIAVYLRLKGIVPPSSEPPSK